ncbi:MAG: acyltransferase [Clostridium sp.]|nr:acyltransferase [Clostridium sp.]
MKNKQMYFDEINIARGLGMIIVLLGHSFPDGEEGYFPLLGYKWAFDYCYAFHMALFFIISGFVMGRKYYGDNFDYKTELINKFKRLIVPYLFYSYVSFIPKLLWNQYARNPVDKTNLWKILLGRSPNGSLWYIYTLFIFATLLLGISKIVKHVGCRVKTIIVLTIGIFFYIAGGLVGEDIMEMLYLERIYRYFIFFAIGLVLYHYYDKWKTYIDWRAGIAALLILMICVCPYLDLSCRYIITGLLGAYGILAVSIVISNRGIGGGSIAYNFLSKCGEYSYDIYIISYYIQQAIRVICFRMLGWNYLLVLLLRFVLGYIGSMFISKYVIRKVSIFRKVLVGKWD